MRRFLAAWSDASNKTPWLEWFGETIAFCVIVYVVLLYLVWAHGG